LKQIYNQLNHRDQKPMKQQSDEPPSASGGDFHRNQNSDSIFTATISVTASPSPENNDPGPT
jgi:hypothetical protein